MKRFVTIFLLLALVGISLAGCSSKQGAKQGKSEKHAARIVYSVPTIGYSPANIATVQGIFQKEGVDAKFEFLSGGGTASRIALQNNETDMVVSSPHEVTQMRAIGLDAIVVYMLSEGILLEVVVSNQLLEKTGVTPNDPIEKRVAALKNANFGAPSLGSTTEFFTRWVMTLGGLKPTDLNIIKVAGGPPTVAAMKQGMIDGVVASAPTPQAIESQGAGKVLIQLLDTEVGKHFPWSVLITTKSFAEKNPESVRRVIKALDQAKKLILEDRAKAVEAMMQIESFKNQGADNLSKSYERLAGAIFQTGKMDQAHWENVSKVFQQVGVFDMPLATKEGILWTNDYVQK